MTNMEHNKYRRQPKWKATKLENNQNGRQKDITKT